MKNPEAKTPCDICLLQDKRMRMLTDENKKLQETLLEKGFTENVSQKFKGQLKEFHVMKDGSLELKVRIWQGFWKQEQIDSFIEPLTEVLFFEFQDDRDYEKWLHHTPFLVEVLSAERKSLEGRLEAIQKYADSLNASHVLGYHLIAEELGVLLDQKTPKAKSFRARNWSENLKDLPDGLRNEVVKEIDKQEEGAKK